MSSPYRFSYSIQRLRKVLDDRLELDVTNITRTDCAVCASDACAVCSRSFIAWSVVGIVIR